MANSLIHICVNYRNDEQTKNFLRNLQALAGAEQVQIFLVNNSASSPADSAFTEFQTSRNFVLINAPENLGYFGAAQKALQALAVPANRVIVSNTDMKIEDPDFYTKLLQARYDEKVAVVGPQVTSELTGHNDNPYLTDRPLRKKMAFLKTIFSHYLTCQLYQLLGMLKAKWQSRKNPDASYQAVNVYAVHGAFMIFLEPFFRSGLDFSHPCFLYGEEIHIAERCLSKGLQTVYDPRMKVIHIEHGSTGWVRYLFNRKTFQFKRESIQALWEHHFQKEML